MGQQDIYNVLKKNKKQWLDAREIANKLGISFGSVIANLSKLRKAGIVLFKHIYKTVKPCGKRLVMIYKWKK